MGLQAAARSSSPAPSREFVRFHLLSVTNFTLVEVTLFVSTLILAQGADKLSLPADGNVDSRFRHETRFIGSS